MFSQCFRFPVAPPKLRSFVDALVEVYIDCTEAIFTCFSCFALLSPYTRERQKRDVEGLLRGLTNRSRGGPSSVDPEISDDGSTLLTSQSKSPESSQISTSLGFFFNEPPLFAVEHRWNIGLLPKKSVEHPRFTGQSVKGSPPHSHSQPSAL